MLFSLLRAAVTLVLARGASMCLVSSLREATVALASARPTSLIPASVARPTELPCLSRLKPSTSTSPLKSKQPVTRKDGVVGVLIFSSASRCEKAFTMAPGSSIVTDVPESDCGDDRLSEALGSIRLDGASTSKPSWAASLVNVGLSSLTGLNDLLECPVCTNSMRPPILQCPNGHTICSNCKHRVENHCPTCHQELGNIRCLALEKVAESLQLPCKYQSLGCTTIHPYQNKLKHEDLCRFRPYYCPYAGSECLITGDVPMLVSHLINDHKVELHEGCTFNHRYVKSNPYEVENATWMLTVFKCFGQHFCLHFEAFVLGMAPVYMAFLRFMGEDSEARNFCYSLEVGGNGRKLTWQGIPRSIRDSHKKVRDSFDGLIIHRNMALFLSGSNRQELKLRVTGRIWKEQ